MTLRPKLRHLFVGLPTGLALTTFLTATPALAAATVNKGDTTWVMIAAILVILMTIPGLALFYGGLVRSKNMLSVLMQVFFCFCMISVLWFIYGYSLAFTNGNGFIGGFSKFMLAGVDYNTLAATFSKETYIPEFAYIIFQLTFAAITPALIVGAFAERMKFSAILLFLVIWFTFAYLPMAHMVWWWAGPDAYTLSADNLDAVKAAVGEAAATDFLAKLAAATDDAAKAVVLGDYATAVNASNGWLFNKGAIDFAGGSVVHINAGVAGLVCAIVLGKRLGLGKEVLAPHNLPFAMIGACLLWVGWFGFNAGSNLEANGLTAQVIFNTILATSAAALSWTARRMGDPWSSQPPRCRHRCRCGPRGRYTCLRLGKPDSRFDHWPNFRRGLPMGRGLAQGQAWLRRFPGRLWRPRHRRHRWCASHRLLRQSGNWRRGRDRLSRHRHLREGA